MIEEESYKRASANCGLERICKEHFIEEATNLIRIGRAEALDDFQTKISMNDAFEYGLQEIVKATTAKYNAEQLITQRESVKTAIEGALKERLVSRGIVVETISITDFQFPGQFNQAIIDKQTAVQLKQKAENDLERIKVEAQQAVAKAQGDAQAIDIINTQLMKSPQFISYKAVTEWNGVLPQVTGSAVPFVQIPMQQSVPTVTTGTGSSP